MPFVDDLLSTEGFNERWYCGLWTDAHGYTHIVSDVLIWGAYTAIPFVLAYFIWRRRDVPLPGVFWLFAAFIFACGTTHLLDSVMFWWPAYRLLAVLKVMTAVVSWATVMALIPATPKALALPGLAVVNAALERENGLRRDAEARLWEANERLEARNRDTREFISIVTHDLKHPLFAIKTMQELLLARAGGGMNDRDREQVSLSIAECDRAMEMLGQLSALSRIERTEVRLEEVDLGELMQRCVDRFQGAAERLRCRVVVSASGGRVRLARQQVEESVNNLVDNALKHGCPGEGGTVEVRAVVEGAWAVIAVSDEGPGIAAEHQERVFGLFQRVPHAATDHGTGVGLAAVRRLMQRIGGEVRLVSEPGSGAVFTLRVPLG